MRNNKNFHSSLKNCFIFSITITSPVYYIIPNLLCKLCEIFNILSYILIMKKIKEYTILFILGVIFIMLFKYSSLIKSSILDSLFLWVTSLIPSMLPIYLILDLLLNYGLMELAYKIFKNNAVLIVIISMISGTPTNAKYLKEFYDEGYICRDTANFLLLFSYSPNPLFVLAMSPDGRWAFFILCSVYLTNLCIFLIFRRRFKMASSKLKPREPLSFINCLSASIAKSASILTLILGVVIVYGILNTILSILNFNSVIISSILELTNALNIIRLKKLSIFWMMFACLFGGLSIHTQIKSILEGTDISYKYFLIGRILASSPFIILALLN